MMSNIIMEGHGSILPLPIKLLVAFALPKCFSQFVHFILILKTNFKNSNLSD